MGKKFDKALVEYQYSGIRLPFKLLEACVLPYPTYHHNIEKIILEINDAWNFYMNKTNVFLACIEEKPITNEISIEYLINKYKKKNIVPRETSKNIEMIINTINRIKEKYKK